MQSPPWYAKCTEREKQLFLIFVHLNGSICLNDLKRFETVLNNNNATFRIIQYNEWQSVPYFGQLLRSFQFMHELRLNLAFESVSPNNNGRMRE